MFLLNSRHPLVCATRLRLPGEGSRLSRSYASNLPSSFSIVPSSASVCSTSPPVSVSGTVSCRGYFLESLSCPSNPISSNNGRDPSPLTGPGMFTWFPSATAFALALGAGSPCADWPCAGTLGLSATGFLALFVATHVRILTSDTSSGPRGSAFTGLRNAPLPVRDPKDRAIHSFGTWLEPRYIVGARTLD